MTTSPQPAEPDPTAEMDDSPAEKAREEMNAAKMDAGRAAIAYVLQVLEGAAVGAEKAANPPPAIQTIITEPNPVADAQRRIREADARRAGQLVPGLFQAAALVRQIRLVPRDAPPPVCTGETGDTDAEPKADLPEPRKDGLCCVCTEKPAETRDGRFCKPCLRKRIKRETPSPPRHQLREQLGRPARSSQVLGGTADMRTEELDAD